MRKTNDYVSASELASLSYCERKVAFNAAIGKRSTPLQRQAQARGDAAHDRFYRDALRIQEASVRKGRCFVATVVLGDSPHMRSLRAFRDVVLRPSAVGRWFIGSYYRLSPCLCPWLERSPSARSVLRPVLVGLARAAEGAVRHQLERDP